MSKLVELHGQRYWLLPSGAIAPLDHCDELGRILNWRTATRSLSYAHLSEDGKIFRYRQQIGTAEDLKFIDK